MKKSKRKKLKSHQIIVIGWKAKKIIYCRTFPKSKKGKKKADSAYWYARSISESYAMATFKNFKEYIKIIGC